MADFNCQMVAAPGVLLPPAKVDSGTTRSRSDIGSQAKSVRTRAIVSGSAVLFLLAVASMGIYAMAGAGPICSVPTDSGKIARNLGDEDGETACDEKQMLKSVFETRYDKFSGSVVLSVGGRLPKSISEGRQGVKITIAYPQHEKLPSMEFTCNMEATDLSSWSWGIIKKVLNDECRSENDKLPKMKTVREVWQVEFAFKFKWKGHTPAKAVKGQQKQISKDGINTYSIKKKDISKPVLIRYTVDVPY